jgi:hypothetical protein
MSGNTISLTQTLDDRQYIEALNKHYQMLDKLERKMSGLAKESKKAGDETKQSFGQVVDTIGRWALSLVGVQQTLNLIVDANRKIRQEAEGVGREYDSIFRKMDALSGISGPESEAIRKKVFQSARTAGTTIKQAALARQALEGSGFELEDAAGPANVALLTGMAALGERDADPAEFATSISSYLAATGQNKTAAGITNVMSTLQTLNPTNFNLQALPDLAKHAAGMTSVAMPEQFAAYATLLETMPSSEAATSLSRIVGKLQTQKDNKSAQRGFKGLGLDNDNVDLIGDGENFFQAVTDIAEAYDKAPVDTRDTDLANIVGQEHFAAFSALMSKKGREAFALNLRRQKDRSGWAKAMEIGTSGRVATENRLDASLAEEALSSDQQDDLIAKQRELMFRQSGQPAMHNAVNAWGYDMARSMGVSQRTAHSMFSPMNISFDEVTAELRKNSQMLSTNTDEMRKQNNSGKAPASPVMQQGRAP